MMRLRFVLLVLLGAAFAGCTDEPGEYDVPLASLDFTVPSSYGLNLSAEEVVWPDLQNATLKLVALDDAPWFAAAAKKFTSLTGAKITKTNADNVTGDDGDLVYGLDRFNLKVHVDAGDLREYQPQLARRVAPEHRFFDATGPWHATPTNHDYMGIFVDDEELPENVTMNDIFALRNHASSWGLAHDAKDENTRAFIQIIGARFGEAEGYNHASFWLDALRGQDRQPCTTDDNLGTEPTDGVFIGRWGDDGRLIDKQAALRMVESTGILSGTDQRAAAEAWIEFTLTDEFQDEVAKKGRSVLIGNGFPSALYVNLPYDKQDSLTARWTFRVDELFEQHELISC